MTEAAASQHGAPSPPAGPKAAPETRGAASRFELSQWLGLTAVLALGGAFLAFRLNSGWFPHDDGVLGQSAERVLLGEVPHRDFDEIYTGLLTYIHALAFKLNGVTLPSLRLPLFAATMVWLVAVYRILLRVTPPLGAVLVTLGALAWSVPNYTASMPSWYNLFCATLGLLALLRWTEDDRTRWLLLAGFAGGVSFLFKLTGIFYVVGGLMALTAVTATRRASEPRADDLRYASALLSICFAAVAGAFLMVMLSAGAAEVTRFALPIAALAISFLAREWMFAGGRGRERMGDVLAAVLPFALGAAIPVLLFFGWFATNGAFSNLVEGVFITPFRRIGFARLSPPSPLMLILALPAAWLLWPRRSPGDPHWRRSAVIASIPLVLAVVLSGTLAVVYQIGAAVAWALPVMACLVGAAAGALRGVPMLESLGERDRNALLCATVVAVFAVLVEYPFAAPIYTLYALPLAMIAVVMAVRMIGRTPPPMQWGLLLFFLAFGLLRVEPTDKAFLGTGQIPRDDTALLRMERGGVWVRPQHAWEYENIVELIQEHAAGQPIWAGPDSPEIYYLSGSRNHTRTMFDFFDPDPGLALRDIQRIGASMIVINMHPGFSPRMSDRDLAQIQATFPHYRSVGRFLVLWR